MRKTVLHTLFPIWLGWALLVLAFQAWSIARFDLVFPDRSQDWTLRFTGPGYQDGHTYLLEPFLNQQVAWDSEYYLAIADGGYDNPAILHIGPPENQVSLSYAFMPFYPWTIRLLSLPLRVFDLSPIATAALAGVIISALGSFFGMLALYDLARDALGESGALRAAFYLLVFPTGFFMLQVYTEGLFVGLAFGCLAMLKRRRLLLAAILASCATLTRAVGAGLLIPMAWVWLRTGEWYDLDLEWRQIFMHGIPLRPLWRGLLAFAPGITFFLWKFSYLGLAFDFVEANYFGRGFLDLGSAFFAWFQVIETVFSGDPASAAYFILELVALVLGFTACIRCLNSDPEIALFSLAVVLFSWGSGPAQGMQRYILTAPAVFFTLARWGENPVFDRLWTVLSIIYLGVLAALFATNFWVA